MGLVLDMEQVEDADSEPCANIEQSRHEYGRNVGQQHFGAGNIQCIKCGRRYSITNCNDILVHDLNGEFYDGSASKRVACERNSPPAPIITPGAAIFITASS